MTHIQINARTVSEVAGMLFKAYNTVKGWRNRFVGHGPNGLAKPRSGRPRKIENHTLDEFLKRASPAIPSEMAADIERDTGMAYADGTLKYHMRNAG